MVSSMGFLNFFRRACLAVLLLMSSVVLAMVGTGCARSAAGSGGTDIDIRVVTDRMVGAATVEVTLRTAEGNPIDTAEVVVRGDMNHAGMKPVVSQARRVASGKYLTEDFRFTMAGDWMLTAQITLTNGDRVERTIEVKGVAGK